MGLLFSSNEYCPAGITNVSSAITIEIISVVNAVGNLYFDYMLFPPKFGTFII